MKILVFLLGLLCTISPGAPRRPEVQARLGRGGHAKTIIDRFEVDVLFFEDLAQTTITVSFEKRRWMGWAKN